MNKAKSKCRVISKFNTEQCNLKIGEETIEKVDSFNYISTLITADGRSEKEIRGKIGMAKTIFQNRKLPLKTRLRILNSYILFVLTYCSET